MQVFEISIAIGALSTKGGPFVPDQYFTFWMPDEASEMLAPIMASYKRSPSWFFDQILFSGRRPWALVCFAEEYPVGDHIEAARLHDDDIRYVPYTFTRERPSIGPMPAGVLICYSKAGLELAATQSLVFERAWDGLRDCSAGQSWIAVLDPFPEDWLGQVGHSTVLKPDP